MGEIRQVLGGTERVFKFGMQSSAIAAKVMVREGIAEDSIEMIAALMYSGLMARQKENGLTNALTLGEVLEWMDETEPDVLADLILEAKKGTGHISRVMEILTEKEDREAKMKAKMKAKLAGTKIQS